MHRGLLQVSTAGVMEEVLVGRVGRSGSAAPDTPAAMWKKSKPKTTP